MTQRGLPIKERLLAGMKVSASGCWVWQKNLVRKGYGGIQVDGKPRLAHRVSYAAFVGPIPRGKFVLHSCDNPSCINPEHLKPVTHKQNMAEMVARGRHVVAGICGVQLAQAKLTDEKVREIRALVSGGTPYSDIVKRYGVSLATVSRAVNRQCWKHVA